MTLQTPIYWSRASDYITRLFAILWSYKWDSEQDQGKHLRQAKHWLRLNKLMVDGTSEGPLLLCASIFRSVPLASVSFLTILVMYLRHVLSLLVRAFGHPYFYSLPVQIRWYNFFLGGRATIKHVNNVNRTYRAWGQIRETKKLLDEDREIRGADPKYQAELDRQHLERVRGGSSQSPRPTWHYQTLFWRIHLTLHRCGIQISTSPS